MLRPSAQVTGTSLIAHCREQLIACKVQRAVHVVELVSMTPSGKIMRRMLTSINDGRRFAA